MSEQLFKVHQHFNGYELEHIPSGQRHWLGDGVDSVPLNDEGDYMLPGGEEFRLAWEAELNADIATTLEAYFYEIAYPPSLLEVLTKALLAKGLQLEHIDDDSLVVTIGDFSYHVQCEPTDVDDEPDYANRLASYPDPKPIKNHSDVLDLCVNALARSHFANRICSLSTDGDGKDCEAIYYDTADKCWYVLKVRPS